MHKVIAIDGPSGAGKSTVSKLLAERLGFRFLDTGALYRAVALHLRRKGLDSGSSDDEIKSALEGVAVFFKDGSVFLKENSELTPPLIPPLVGGGDGGVAEDVSEAIRTTEAGHYASVFSARKPVRDFLLQVQRDAALRNDIVAEGRDMTTVVFPDAWRKFYLDASEKGRAKRRHLQMQGKGAGITMDEALKDVKERDTRDSSRDIAPLCKAEDAVYIDTSEMSIEDVLTYMMKVIESNH
jgi:cytidylate kinase